MAKRRAKNSVPPWALALGIGGVVYLLLKPRSTGASLPAIPAPVSAPRTSTGTPAPQANTVATGVTPAILSRLGDNGTNGALARQVFYVQSVLYSYADVNSTPDGLLGPQTWSDINSVRRDAGMPQDTVWMAQTIADVVQAVKLRRAELSPPRILPFALPSDLIDRINADVVPLAGRGAPLLQAYGSG